MAGKPADRLRDLAGVVLLPVEGSEGSTGSPRVYIAPRRKFNLATRPAENTPDDHGPGFALVDGISTSLVGEPWPGSLVVNLTEDLLTRLMVDRRHVDPAEATVKSVLDWIYEHGGAALAAWSSPDFLALHLTLKELDPQVTAATNAILRATPRPNETMTSHWAVDWPLSAGVSDIDPEIFGELLLASRETSAFRFRLTVDPEARALKRLNLRENSESSIDPFVTEGIFHRTRELADAGLALPDWVQRAVSFETCDGMQAFPASYHPAITALDASGQVGLSDYWIPNNTSRTPDTGVLSQSRYRQRPPDLTRKQEILISADLDGVNPFLANITMEHLFNASRHREFGTFAETVRVARSFADTAAFLPHIFGLDDRLIAQFDAMPIAGGNGFIISRFFHAFDHHRPASVWDLALAATAANIEPQGLSPLLGLLEGCGGDVARCRDFLAFCAEGEGSRHSDGARRGSGPRRLSDRAGRRQRRANP